MPARFFYGWVIVAVCFITMGVGVNARTAFSLLFPPILDEFGWERGVTAGAFSFGFLVSAVLSPALGRLMDRRGPRVVMEMGVGLIGVGLLLATFVSERWHLYATLGVMVGGGSVCLGYAGQGLFLPNWFVRRRGLAMSVASHAHGETAAADEPVGQEQSLSGIPEADAAPADHDAERGVKMPALAHEGGEEQPHSDQPHAHLHHHARPAPVHETAEGRAQDRGDEKAEGKGARGDAALPAELVEDGREEQGEGRARVDPHA